MNIQINGRLTISTGVFKSDNSPPSLGRKCDRTEMRAYFRKPFTAAEHENDYIELHSSVTPWTS